MVYTENTTQNVVLYLSHRELIQINSDYFVSSVNNYIGKTALPFP